jgi:hypothetical protein
LCAEVLETSRKIQPDEKPFNYGLKAANFVENRSARDQNAHPVQAAFAAFFVGDGFWISITQHANHVLRRNCIWSFSSWRMC